MNKKATISLIIIVFGLGLFLAILYPRSGYDRKTLDVFASCLAEKGAVMYGVAWCPHCENEKKRFGGSFKFIPYVECPDEPQKCLAAGVEGYPTWIFTAGLKFEGEQGLEKLSEISSCPLDSASK